MFVRVAQCAVLDAAGQREWLSPMVAKLGEAGIRVSLFIEPDPRQIEAALQLRSKLVAGVS